jgi:HEAT repeat protein
MPCRLRCTALLAALAVLTGARSQAQLVEPVDEHLIAMSTGGEKYDPRELDALGVAGLTGVLDRFFPDTAAPPKDPPPREDIERLIGQLGSDEFQVREQATATLMAVAKPRQELLIAAAEHDDAEVRLRARRILAAWQPPPAGSWTSHQAGFSVYVRQIKDRERLAILARRAADLLAKGLPAAEDAKLVKLCIEGVAQGRDESSSDLLRPLLHHEDERVALLVVEGFGRHHDNHHYPPLLIEALANPRDAVVAKALASGPCPSWDKERAAALRAALQSVFAQRKEPLKFQACFALMHNFRDPQAMDYILEQTHSPDAGRAFQAIGWIGDACNFGQPATQKLLDKLQPHVESKNAEFRRAAARALATYSGEEVVQRLIPLLGDLTPIIIEEVKLGLRQQRDKKLVRRLLAEAAAGHADPRVRSRAQEVLDRPEDE